MKHSKSAEMRAGDGDEQQASLFGALAPRGEQLAELPEVDARTLFRRDELLAVLGGRRRHRIRPQQHHDLGQGVVVVVGSVEGEKKTRQARVSNLIHSGASGCEKGFVKCFVKVPLAYLSSMAAAVQPIGQWNSRKTFYKTYFTT